MVTVGVKRLMLSTPLCTRT